MTLTPTLIHHPNTYRTLEHNPHTHHTLTHTPVRIRTGGGVAADDELCRLQFDSVRLQEIRKAKELEMMRVYRLHNSTWQLGLSACDVDPNIT